MCGVCERLACRLQGGTPARQMMPSTPMPSTPAVAQTPAERTEHQVQLVEQCCKADAGEDVVVKLFACLFGSVYESVTVSPSPRKTTRLSL